MAKKYDYKNLTKQQQACLVLVESLGIYELRALARIFGDSSPTTLKRSDHIQIIMDKIISGEDIRPLPLRQGRPFKELSNIEGILKDLSEASGKDYTMHNTQTPIKASKNLTFKQIQKEILEQKLDPIKVKGIVAEEDGKQYLYDCDKQQKILLKQDEKVRANDYITATAVVMNKEKQYITEQVKTINYEDYQTYKISDCPYLQTIPNMEVKLSDNKILLGSRYVLKTPKFAKKVETIKNFVASLKEKNIKSIVIAPNILFEDKQALSKIGFDGEILLNYDEKPSVVVESVKNLINHITRLQNQGKSVAVFVEDVVSLKNIIDAANSQPNEDENSTSLTRQLVKLAMAGKHEKSTTLLFTMDESDLFDQTFMSAIYKVSEKVEI